MTLIANYINKDYIIIAADKRGTRFSEEEKIATSIDNAVKLFCGENYCIGIQGTVKTKKSNYHDRVAKFVEDHPSLLSPALSKELDKYFDDVSGDTEIDELNLTVSGTDGKNLFSKYIDLKGKSVTDCYSTDEMGLRFNRCNSSNDMFFRQAKIFISQFFMKTGLLKGYTLEDLGAFGRDEILDSFRHVYQRFGDNDNKYPLIGPDMDYCIIEKTGIVEKHIAYQSEE